MNRTKNKSIPKRLVIIPARGGSKRIPNKNMVDVCGSPIIRYPIETAIASNLFHEVLVSSDDAKILEFVSKIGKITLSQRPKEHSEDHSTIFSTLKHEYLLKKKQGINYDEVWLLSATACLIHKSDLINISNAFQNLDSPKAMLAVTEYEVPVRWAMTIDQSGKLKSQDFVSFRNRSQDLEKFYHDTGCVAVFAPDVFDIFLDGIPDGNFDSYILDRNRSIDIDDFQDLELVRALMAYKD